jgi:AcrR family transcriptional regulator
MAPMRMQGGRESVPTTPERRPGRPARLRRDDVIRAAVELADRDGLEAVTMRALAHRLRAEAMSLYRHVANKEDLLDGMVDLVYAEIELPMPDAAGGWKEALRTRTISVREVLTRHPWAVALMESRRRPGPANLGHHDAMSGVLLAAGFDGAETVRIANIIDSYVFGFVLQERVLPVATADQLAEAGPEILGAMPDGAYPHLARVAEELIAARFEYGSEFEAGLDIVLDALEDRVRPAPADGAGAAARRPPRS